MRTGLDKPDGRLHARIDGKRLVISIGMETLAFAAEKCDGNPQVKILSDHQLALDVIHELEKENEIGMSRLSDLFDGAITAAWENGSTAFEDTARSRE
jgi:hypothetical protein